MIIDTEKLAGFNLTMQLSVGRALQRHSVLLAKTHKTSADIAELERVSETLRPFSDLQQKPLPPVTACRDEREARVAADNRGIVLNARKIDAAALTGAQRLSLHRQSATLARLLVKSPDRLSTQEGFELKRLRDSLRPFVGMEGSEGKDGDFKQVAS